MDDPVALSHQLLRAVRTGEDTRELEAALADLDAERLAAATAPDGATIAFWTNVYNAVTQLALQRNPDQYDKRTFFRKEVVHVAGRQLSLDDVENGILRRGYFKYGLGYIPNPFQRGFKRRMRVGERDWRIHFALNCGAKSCPPIAAYSREGIDEELTIATESYLSQEVTYDAAADEVTVPRLMLWFRGDFGGKSGIYEILREYDCIPDAARPSLSYAEYDWDLQLDQYREETA
jgi:hypothetical protein